MSRTASNALDTIKGASTDYTGAIVTLRAMDAPAPAATTRLVSLDVFRGLTMAAMVIVNNPGDGGRDGDGVAGYATFNLSVTKTGGLTVTASSSGAVGIEDQDVAEDSFRTNGKP